MSCQEQHRGKPERRGSRSGFVLPVSLVGRTEVRGYGSRKSPTSVIEITTRRPTPRSNLACGSHPVNPEEQDGHPSFAFTPHTCQTLRLHPESHAGVLGDDPGMHAGLPALSRRSHAESASSGTDAHREYGFAMPDRCVRRSLTAPDSYRRRPSQPQRSVPGDR